MRSERFQAAQQAAESYLQQIPNGYLKKACRVIFATTVEKPRAIDRAKNLALFFQKTKTEPRAFLKIWNQDPQVQTLILKAVNAVHEIIGGPHIENEEKLTLIIKGVVLVSIAEFLPKDDWETREHLFEAARLFTMDRDTEYHSVNERDGLAERFLVMDYLPN